MKRFTETTKWADPWFRKLPVEYKALWSYLCDNCDSSGVWVVDLELASFHIGHAFSEKECLPMFGSRVEDIGNGHWWIPKFVPFQYGELSPTCRPHVPVLALLRKNSLIDRVLKGYAKGTNTLKEEDKSKDKEKDFSEGKGSGEGKRFSPFNPSEAPTIEQWLANADTIGYDRQDAENTFNEFDSIGWITRGQPIRDWRRFQASCRGKFQQRQHIDKTKASFGNGKPKVKPDYSKYDKPDAKF